jgi:hypothetical protein
MAQANNSQTSDGPDWQWIAVEVNWPSVGWFRFGGTGDRSAKQSQSSTQVQKATDEL